MTRLTAWLILATRGLSEESAAKVRAEIEAHYGSAIASGATNEDAVAALGAPKAANRQYKAEEALRMTRLKLATERDGVALLTAWLIPATRGLTEESAAKVRAEIEEHYGSAIANGATEEAAVEALGEPKAANRQYRKVLLTNGDAKWLALVKRRASAPIGLWYIQLAAALIGILRGTPDEAWVVLANVSMAAVFLLPRWVRIDTKIRSYGYRTLRFAVLLSFPVVVATRWHWNPAFTGCAWFAWATLFVLDGYRDHLLRRKLPAEDWPKKLYL